MWLWDTTARRPLGPPLTGHTDVVDGVAFSPDGRTLASTGADHMLRLWDVPTRRPLGGPLEGHAGWVSTVAFSPDGRSSPPPARTGRSGSGTRSSGATTREALERRVCAAIRRSLTRAEWREFLPDRPYRETCR